MPHSSFCTLEVILCWTMFYDHLLVMPLCQITFHSSGKVPVIFLYCDTQTTELCGEIILHVTSCCHSFHHSWSASTVRLHEEHFFTEFHRKYTKPFKAISKKLNHFLPKSLTECMSKCWGKKRNNDIWKAINTVKGWNMFRVFLNGEANMNYLCFWLKFHWYLKLHRQYS